MNRMLSIFNIYNYDRNQDGYFSLKDDFPEQSGKELDSFRENIQEMPVQPRTYIYSQLDQPLRQKLNINYDHEMQELKLLEKQAVISRWPIYGETIVEMADVFGLKPALVEAFVQAEASEGLAYTKAELSEFKSALRTKLHDIFDQRLKKQQHNLLWALADYHLEESAGQNTPVREKYLRDWKIFRQDDNFERTLLFVRDNYGFVEEKRTSLEKNIGIAATAYFPGNSKVKTFVEKIISNYITINNQGLLTQDYTPAWIAQEFNKQVLKSGWRWSELLIRLNLKPEESAVAPLSGRYFELYHKLVYLGLAKDGSKNYTNENLIDAVKDCGYLNIGLTDLKIVRDYRFSGQVGRIFPEPGLNILLTKVDEAIEKVKTNKKLVRNICYINLLSFRENWNKECLKILKEAADELGKPIKELIKIKYQDQFMNEWTAPEAKNGSTYYWFIDQIRQEQLNKKYRETGQWAYHFIKDYELIVGSELQKYLTKKYDLYLENYDLKAQQNLLKNISANTQLDLAGQSTARKESYTQTEINNLLKITDDFIYNSPPTGWPLTGEVWITSQHGYRRNPFDLSKTEYHPGIDLNAPRGTKIYAIGGGKVIFAGEKYGLGKTVEIEFSLANIMRYAHMSEILITQSETIEKGRLIGLSGQTGRATGAHLHLEHLVNGQSVEFITQDISIFKAFNKFYLDNKQKYSRQ